jgi:hypothetical protein
MAAPGRAELQHGGASQLIHCLAFRGLRQVLGAEGHSSSIHQTSIVVPTISPGIAMVGALHIKLLFL